MAPAISLAFALPSASSGVDWLYQFTNNLTNLTTQNGGALTELGLAELSCISLFMLVSMVVNWSTAGMTLRFHLHAVHFGDLVHFLLRLLVCCLLENYWVNALPGASFGINHLFSYIAQAMVAAFDQNSLDSLLQLLKTAGDGTPMPSLIAPVQILCYFLVQMLLGLASGILFLINCSAFILYGVTALFGPVFVPLLMTNTFRAKFFHFLDVLISFAMIRAVAAAFIFVWAGFMNTFIQQTFNGDYSIEMWLANLIPCTMVFLAFIINMLFIPSMTQAIFGGAAGLTLGACGNAVGMALNSKSRSSITMFKYQIHGHAMRKLGLRRPLGLLVLLVALGCVMAACIYFGVIVHAIVERRDGPPCPRKPSLKNICPPRQALMADEIGNEVYASHYAERKAYRLILVCETVLLSCSMWLNLSLARRPVAYRYIRIDEMGRAQAIQYSDLNYSPREGEVRTYLNDWANYRYTINHDTIATKYPLNYYFLSRALATSLMTEDNQNHLVSAVVGGQIEQSDAEVKNVTITSLSQETIQGAVLARGTALIALDRIYSPIHSHQPRTEHWMLSLTYYLNPKQVSDQAKIYPQYEFINPLGLTITEYHENRISVDPLATDGATSPVNGGVR